MSSVQMNDDLKSDLTCNPNGESESSEVLITDITKINLK